MPCTLLAIVPYQPPVYHLAELVSNFKGLCTGNCKMESELPKNVSSLDEGISESKSEMQDVMGNCISEEHNEITSYNSASGIEIDSVLMPKSLSEKETQVIHSISSSNSSMSESSDDDAAHNLSETSSFESLPKDFSGSKYDVYQDSECELIECELNAPSDQNSESENNNCKMGAPAADEVSRAECDLESVPVHCSVADADENSFSPVSTCRGEISLDDKKQNDGQFGSKESVKQSDVSPETKDSTRQTDGHSGTKEITRQSDSHSGTKESVKQSDVHPETKESARQSNCHSGTKESVRPSDGNSGTKENTRQSYVHPETKSARSKINDEPHIQSECLTPNCTGMAVSCAGADRTVDTIKENSSRVKNASFYVHPCIHSYPCCAHATRLYNQYGRLCTLFDKRYIFTEVHQAPVLVCLESEDSEVMPSQFCRILWRGNTPLVLSELEDGTELMFDALALPESKKSVALVVWHTYKPDVVPLLSKKWSLFLLEEVTGFHVKFLSYCQKYRGYVRAIINGREEEISYSLEEVFVNGKKARNVEDVAVLSQLPPASIYITANKFLLLTGASDCYTYKATCVWNGVKPIALSLQPPLPQGKVYSAPDTDSVPQEVSNYSKLYCDIPCHLSLKKPKGTVPPSGEEFKLEFILDNEMKSVCCTSEKLFWGNSQVTEIKYPLPLIMKVKAHILKQRLEKGREKWTVILVQVHNENVTFLDDGTFVSLNNDVKGSTQEMNTKNSSSLSSLNSVTPTSHREVPCGVAGANLTAAWDVSGALHNPSPDSSIIPQSTTFIQDNLNTHVSISTDNQWSNNMPSSFMNSLHSVSSNCSSQAFLGSSVSLSNSHASCQVSSTMSNTTYCNSENLPAVKVITDQSVQKVCQPYLSSEESQIQLQKPGNAVTEKSENSKKKKHLYRVSCTIEKVAAQSGIVKARGKVLNYDNPKAHFLNKVVFLNGRTLLPYEFIHFSSAMGSHIGKECTCLFQVCKPQNICNENVYFTASLLWIGKIPVDAYDIFTKNYNIEVISPESSSKVIQKTSSQIQTLSAVQSALLESSAMSKVSPQRGVIKVVAVTVGTVQSCEAGSKGELCFDRKKCFLFNICLENVALNDVIPAGISVEYEQHGGKVVKVYVGNTYAEADSQDSATRYYLMSAWCQQYDVPLETKEELLLSIGWLPPELEPIAADDTDLVDIP